MILRRSVVAGTGSYLPRAVVGNEELARRIDTTDQWIFQRTGIKQRHLASNGETASSMGASAARAAMAAAAAGPEDIDLIVLATTTADRIFPSSAVRIQADLGIGQGAAFDVQAVCSGFIFALATADNFLRLGQAKTALVIGSEVYSRILDWEDRSTCVLFGDGAGAIVLRAEDATDTERGILTTQVRSDGRYEEHLYVDGGVGSTGTVGKLRMHGREVFRHAISKMASAVDAALAATGFESADIDWLVPHQANIRIIESMAKKLDLPMSKVILTVADHANTSAASIPLALDRAVRDGRIKPGHVVLMEALGGGFTWGSALLRW